MNSGQKGSHSGSDAKKDEKGEKNEETQLKIEDANKLSQDARMENATGKTSDDIHKDLDKGKPTTQHDQGDQKYPGVSGQKPDKDHGPEAYGEGKFGQAGQEGKDGIEYIQNQHKEQQQGHSQPTHQGINQPQAQGHGANFPTGDPKQANQGGQSHSSGAPIKH